MTVNEKKEEKKHKGKILACVPDEPRFSRQSAF